MVSNIFSEYHALPPHIQWSTYHVARNVWRVARQRATLATAHRYMARLEPERLLPGLQLRIRAFYMLSRDAAFASARGHAEARRAVEVWKRQCVMDDVTGESLLLTESAIKVCVRWIICGAYLGVVRKR